MIVGNGANGYDVAFSSRPTVTSPFPPPTVLNVVGSVADEQDPSLTADGLELYFVSDRITANQATRMS